MFPVMALPRPSERPRRARCCGPYGTMCSRRRGQGIPHGPLYAGLCCTHYSYVKEQFRLALERQTGRKVRILDPNERMTSGVIAAKAEGDLCGARRADRGGDFTGQTGCTSGARCRTRGPDFPDDCAGTPVVYLAARAVLRVEPANAHFRGDVRDLYLPVRAAMPRDGEISESLNPW